MELWLIKRDFLEIDENFQMKPVKEVALSLKEEDLSRPSIWNGVTFSLQEDPPNIFITQLLPEDTPEFVKKIEDTSSENHPLIDALMKVTVEESALSKSKIQIIKDFDLVSTLKVKKSSLILPNINMF